MAEIAYFPAGKREQTKVQNRQAILDAAREVFGELGYEAATVRDIIRRTGLAAGTFYNYYRSKEEVFAALADDGARRFGPILKGLRAQHGADFESFAAAAIAEGKGPPADTEYMTAACIAVAREVGEKMLERRPVDTKGAADFAIAMILHGLQGLPEAQT